MDTNTDRIINLLLSTTAEGEIASELRDEITSLVLDLVGVEELADAANGSTDAFVDALIDSIVDEIVETRGDRRVVASVIGTSYLTGLIFGLAIATMAAEA